MSFKKRAATGVIWSSASQFGRQGMQFITTVILARLLSPSDFGLVAMVVIGFVSIFAELGTSAAVVQRKKTSEELLSTIFWVNALFGVLVMAVIFLSAPMVADLYHMKVPYYYIHK